ncbi:predicted protein [Uncinocarpus reesii 1704]|uniref:Uncharacterized protein n=1 Tax=Uncinocarpus reesii (strain UAMH 1704) TaxID=336963 RepID=C4JFY8_UNCRE|nr:uncharacterized protein UREG_01068 [Uncinocarpus reesii 1704]EEP76219.1 predicted protein [Uncinocarpus reesii 1704]
MILAKRRECWTYDNGRTYHCSVWSDWGRWVFLAILIAGAFLLFFLFACISARRRRRRGMRPFMGTGWVANMAPYGKPGTHPPPPQYQHYPPPPQYTPAGGPYYPGPGYNANPPPNQGQTSHQQTGVELQPPQNAYRGESVYGPPPDAPGQQKTV